MNTSSRKKLISDLDLFLMEKNELVNNVLGTLGWDKEKVKEAKCRCPIDANHWIPEPSVSRHEKICKYVQEGYLKEDLLKDSQDSSLFYEKAPNVVHVDIDSTMQETVLAEKGLLTPGQYKPLDFPQTVDRWSVQLNPEQRLAIYDHVVKIAKETNKQTSISLDELMVNFDKNQQDSDKPKSKLELMAEMRDYKRRRQSYRAKNVHITKKSYTEIMREVIGNQMSYLEEIVKVEQSEKSKSDDNEKSPSRNPKDDSDSNHSSLKHERHRESGSRKRHHHDREDSSDEHEHRSRKKKHKKHHSHDRSPSRHKHKKHHKRSHD